MGLTRGDIDTWNLADISGVACSTAAYSLKLSRLNCSIFVIFLLAPLIREKDVLMIFLILGFFNGRVFSSKL